ncbi:hypothetical protein NC652_024407 [Populus alba x Populus x berolinensis]|nr:hypothetical protein NC652_024407 [Populus alba x Populus x berolinensis]
MHTVPWQSIRHLNPINVKIAELREALEVCYSRAEGYLKDRVIFGTSSYVTNLNTILQINMSSNESTRRRVIAYTVWYGVPFAWPLPAHSKSCISVVSSASQWHITGFEL